MQEIQKSNKAGSDTIVNDLSRIKENRLSEIKGNFGDNFYKVLNKLLDHICLEFSRMQSVEEIAERLLNSENNMRTLQEQIEQSQKNYENLQTKTDGIQKQFVAVLGIFASIIMVFSGGLSFTNATLSAIANANILKLIALSLTVGLVLIDVYFGLFYWLDRLVNSEDKGGKFKPPWVINLILLATIILFALCAA